MESFFQRSIMKSRDASGSKERPSVARVACSRCYAVLCCMCQSPEKLLQCKLCSRMQATALFAGYQKRRHGATLKVAGQTSDESLVDIQGRRRSTALPKLSRCQHVTLRDKTHVVPEAA
jgi:hypothetical protein